MGLFKYEPTLLEEGAVVEYDGRVWRVGLVNECRARLDPVTGTVTQANPVSGRTFMSYGGSVNITPTATHLKEVDLATLDTFAIRRLMRLQEQADLEEERKAAQISKRERERRPVVAPPVVEVEPELEDDEDAEGTVGAVGDEDTVDEEPADGAATREPVMEDSMATAQTSSATGPAAPMPVATKTKADRNKERLQQIAAKKGVTKAAANGAAGKTAKVKEPKPARQCVCGCGAVTGGYFVPGHDAKFKGLMLKVERGQVKKEEAFSPVVIAAYKWVNVKGGGQRTTTNYKGETHGGYDVKRASSVDGAAAAE